MPMIIGAALALPALSCPMSGVDKLRTTNNADAMPATIINNQVSNSTGKIQHKMAATMKGI